MIKTVGLTVDYGNGNGIFDIDMTVPKGAIYALIGHSGCGKTTLLSTLAGLMTFDQGEMTITKEQGDRAKIGLIQQKDALFPWLKVWENMALGLKKEKKIKMASARALLKDLEIDPHWDSYPSQLSGGQRQRVSIGRTLISDPDVLLMDEPTASLDAFSKEALQDLLLSLYMKKNRTTLFVTHSIEEALFLADKVLIMDRGRIAVTYDNPLVHTLELRDSPDFYEEVKALRHLLKRGGHSE